MSDVLTIGSQKLYHHHTSVSHSTHRRGRRATRGNLPSRVVFGRCWAVPTPRSQTLHHDARLLVAERLALPYTQQHATSRTSIIVPCLFVPFRHASTAAPQAGAKLKRHARGPAGDGLAPDDAACAHLAPGP